MLDLLFEDTIQHGNWKTVNTGLLKYNYPTCIAVFDQFKYYKDYNLSSTCHTSIVIQHIYNHMYLCKIVYQHAFYVEIQLKDAAVTLNVYGLARKCLFIVFPAYLLSI